MCLGCFFFKDTARATVCDCCQENGAYLVSAKPIRALALFTVIELGSVLSALHVSALSALLTSWLVQSVLLLLQFHVNICLYNPLI